jgi:hypothetical protein
MSDDILPPAHLAIRMAKEGRMSGKEMLDELMAGTITIPLLQPAVIENDEIAEWRPATSKQDDGSEWLVAFTLPQLAAAFGAIETQFGHLLTVETRWLLARLPPHFGIVFNVGSEEMFEWKAEGLAKYRKEVLGWLG